MTFWHRMYISDSPWLPECLSIYWHCQYDLELSNELAQILHQLCFHNSWSFMWPLALWPFLISTNWALHYWLHLQYLFSRLVFTWTWTFARCGSFCGFFELILIRTFLSKPFTSHYSTTEVIFFPTFIIPHSFCASTATGSENMKSPF